MYRAISTREQQKPTVTTSPRPLISVYPMGSRYVCGMYIRNYRHAGTASSRRIHHHRH
ncbi:hypothetical protein K504DRAFT_459084 [Pleomassaria siparia CBS 279.74]|uniref:Uncharacterized protein n=1 Tax=Pleomassaria siparia CBS 279.74 TaxID=1314801 RepID=A0A6G1K2R4_9PLEO|nr:hypothetical protein K504DRAFT_459084 [Pleomassaria siparia CBS 279.74]